METPERIKAFRRREFDVVIGSGNGMIWIIFQVFKIKILINLTLRISCVFDIFGL